MFAEHSSVELSVAELSADYGRIEAAIHYLEENFQAQPTLAEVAAHVGLSDYHFQRLFSRWAGTSPKRFLQFLTIQHAKQLLAESQSILDATYEAGLSSPSRLHDLFVTHEAITPGEFKQKGSGLTIQYGFHDSPFGECLIALTERGICGLQFVANGDRAAALAELQASWPQAQFVADDEATRPFINPIFHLSNAGGTTVPAPLPQRDQLPNPGVAGAAEDSGGNGRFLRYRGPVHRQSQSVPRRGQRRGQQSHRLPHPLPSRHPSGGRPGRLPLGQQPQESDFGLGSGPLPVIGNR